MDRRRALGIGLVVVAGASFASGSIFATLSYGEGLDWLTLLGWRFLIGAGLAWAWVVLSPSRRASVRGLSRRQLAVTLALGAVYTAPRASVTASWRRDRLRTEARRDDDMATHAQARPAPMRKRQPSSVSQSRPSP